MNYISLALGTLGATTTYLVLGGILFAALPMLQKEFLKYPNVFRPKDEMMRVMPLGMAAIVLENLVVTVLYAMAHPTGGSVAEGAQLGALIGVFAVCGFALHNHMNLNIGIKLTLGQGVAYFLQWLAVGIVVSWIYTPAPGH